MSDFTPLSAVIGGLLIGSSAGLFLVLNGRIAGVSGIAYGAFTERGFERGWRILFVAGLLLGGACVSLVDPTRVAFDVDRPLWTLVLAGLLVGFGAKLANGCTSGHGVCGLGRASPRSAVAVATFSAVAAITASAFDLLGGQP